MARIRALTPFVQVDGERKVQWKSFRFSPALIGQSGTSPPGNTTGRNQTFPRVLTRSSSMARVSSSFMYDFVLFLLALEKQHIKNAPSVIARRIESFQRSPGPRLVLSLHTSTPAFSRSRCSLSTVFESSRTYEMKTCPHDRGVNGPSSRLISHSSDFAPETRSRPMPGP